MSAESIQAAYEKFIESEERRGPQTQRNSVYASSWTACTRQMALDMLRPDIKPPFQADTLANFRRGNDRARDIKADFTKVGRYSEPAFDVIGAEERFELRDKKGRVVIVGKVDFRLKYTGQKGSIPVETKSYHPNLTQGVKRFEDMFGNRWLRKGAHQLLCYMYGSNEETGIMLLDRPGIPRPLEVKLYDHLDKVEDFLQRAEVAMDAREAVRSKLLAIDTDKIPVEYAEELLPPFTDDPAECRVCPFFGSACNPPLSYQGATIITEEDILLAIERHDALDEPRAEYKGLHDELAEHLKLRVPKTATKDNKQQIIAGKYLVTAHWGPNTTYHVPEEVKKGFRKVDATGKFNFEIERVSE
jgi:hypothetical protein